MKWYIRQVAETEFLIATLSQTESYFYAMKIPNFLRKIGIYLLILRTPKTDKNTENTEIQMLPGILKKMPLLS